MSLANEIHQLSGHWELVNYIQLREQRKHVTPRCYIAKIQALHELLIENGAATEAETAYVQRELAWLAQIDAQQNTARALFQGMVDAGKVSTPRSTPEARAHCAQFMRNRLHAMVYGINDPAPVPGHPDWMVPWTDSVLFGG